MTTILLTLTIGTALAQKSEEAKIKELVTTFVKAGDTYDVVTLDSILDDNYSIVMNRLFGSKTVSVMNKTDYIANIASKTFGGDKRRLEFETITINNNTASVKVKLIGDKAKVVSILLLVQNETGEWFLVGDIPTFI